MSVVQIAVDEVKNLSEADAEALLEWLQRRRAKPRPRKSSPRAKSRKQRMAELMAWYDSIRGTTDWEPPRMPDDPVGPPMTFEMSNELRPRHKSRKRA